MLNNYSSMFFSWTPTIMLLGTSSSHHLEGSSIIMMPWRRRINFKWWTEFITRETWLVTIAKECHLLISPQSLLILLITLIRRFD